jgi:hypothetical protein
LQCRPTPTYVWKARRRKFQKRKNLTKKRFEILEIASDIDTDDDCLEEQIESSLDGLHQKGGNNPLNNHLKKVNWLNQTLHPLKQRKCSSDENSASDSEEACKYNTKNAANCSSEEDTCDVDRDSDYEYFHVWGESDSGHSDLNVAEDIDVTAGSSFLENVPKKKKALRLRKIAPDYDAPSPEPFLPDANEPCEPISCVHKISACDTLVTSLINLGISNPSADMPHFLCIPPCNVIEKPYDFVNESNNCPQLTESSPGETSAVCKRKLLNSPDAGECTPGKLVRFADNSSRPSLLLSPSNSDPMSISSLNSDDEASSSEVKSGIFEQNPLKHNLDVKLICNESSPFHTPVSEMDCTSPPKTLKAGMCMYT